MSFRLLELLVLTRVEQLLGEREPPPEGSFLSEERSFSKAPLGSRLPPVSPHRVTSSSSATAAARRTLKGKGKRVQRVDDEDDEDEDDGGGGERILGGGINGVSDDDESSFDDDEDEDEERVETRLRPERVEKESLEGLGDDLQEALIVEDLLAVLMVRLLTSRSWKRFKLNALAWSRRG